MIEFEEGYFTIEFTEIEQEKGIRRRSDVGKFNVAIMGQSVVLKIVKRVENPISADIFKQSF